MANEFLLFIVRASTCKRLFSVLLDTVNCIFVYYLLLFFELITELQKYEKDFVRQKKRRKVFLILIILLISRNVLDNQ